MPASQSTLENSLGYQFKNREYLGTALTHRSYGNDNNERFEFLGDAILGFVIADALVHRFPTAAEGQLSRLRARLVRRQTLAEMARSISLDEYLTMGSGEMRSGEANRDSVLSDALEAIICAIYYDSDLDTARRCVLKWFDKYLDSLSLTNLQKDAKTRLQEFLQAQKSPLPEYRVVNISGKAPKQMFKVECHSELLVSAARGEGRSRRVAEQGAAAAALSQLGMSEEATHGE